MTRQDMQELIDRCSEVRLAWCLTGHHYGVSMPDMMTCPYCEYWWENEWPSLFG